MNATVMSQDKIDVLHSRLDDIEQAAAAPARDGSDIREAAASLRLELPPRRQKPRYSVSAG